MVAAYETKIWINEIKAKGITTFKFDDLKQHNLAHKKYLSKASTLCLIREIGRTVISKHPVAIWTIT
jgi:hypothetical protein